MNPAISVLDMNRPLKQRLFDFPGEIRAQKTTAEAARATLKEAKNALTEAEAMLVAEIAAEVNPDTSKAAFTNAEQRGAELIRRKAESKEYAAAYGAVRRADEAVSVAQFDLERLYDEFRAYRCVVDLTAREIALLCVDGHAEGRASRDDDGGGGFSEPEKELY